MNQCHVAQSVERLAVNEDVLGSNPSLAAKYRGLSILGDAPVFQTGKPGSIPGFRSNNGRWKGYASGILKFPPLFFAAIAQLAEQHPCKLKVVGSIPTGGTILALLVLLTTTACGGCFVADTNRSRDGCPIIPIPSNFA